jgi:small subunit ribosomal protein S18
LGGALRCLADSEAPPKKKEKKGCVWMNKKVAVVMLRSLSSTVLRQASVATTTSNFACRCSPNITMRYASSDAGGGRRPSPTLTPEQVHPNRIFYPGQQYAPEELNWADDQPKWRKVQRRAPPADLLGGNLELLDPFNIRMLSRFITAKGKIQPRRVTGLTAKGQRRLARAVKTSRQIGLLSHSEGFVGGKQ